MITLSGAHCTIRHCLKRKVCQHELVGFKKTLYHTLTLVYHLLISRNTLTSKLTLFNETLTRTLKRHRIKSKMLVFKSVIFTQSWIRN
jgi:hypothetical protein